MKNALLAVMIGLFIGDVVNDFVLKVPPAQAEFTRSSEHNLYGICVALTTRFASNLKGQCRKP